MSLIADIRAQMALESGPVHPKHLAEVLEQDLATVRNTMNQASTKGHGIERLDDGTFSLIPNWAPARGPNAAADPAPTPSPTKPFKPLKVKKPLKGSPAKKPKKAKAAKVKDDKPKRAYTRRSNHKASQEAAATTLPVSAERPDVPSPMYAVITRTALALLVEGVLASDAPITASLRLALREATKPSVLS